MVQPEGDQSLKKKVLSGQGLPASACAGEIAEDKGNMKMISSPAFDHAKPTSSLDALGTWDRRGLSHKVRTGKICNCLPAILNRLHFITVGFKVEALHFCLGHHLLAGRAL